MVVRKVNSSYAISRSYKQDRTVSVEKQSVSIPSRTVSCKEHDLKCASIMAISIAAFDVLWHWHLPRLGDRSSLFLTVKEKDSQGSDVLLCEWCEELTEKHAVDVQLLERMHHRTAHEPWLNGRDVVEQDLPIPLLQ